MRILSEHKIHHPEKFLRGVNAAVIKGIPRFRLYQRLVVADRSRAFFQWEAASEHELREFLQRHIPMDKVHDFGLWVIPIVQFLPLIISIFPFSVIKPGGGVIVQGVNFQSQPGRLLLNLNVSGMQLDLTNLQWGDSFAAGTIPMITGVPDQPGFLQVVTHDGKETSGPWSLPRPAWWCYCPVRP